MADIGSFMQYLKKDGYPSDRKYRRYFLKEGLLYRKTNLNVFDYIDECVKHAGTGKTRPDVCVFNPRSLSNLMRAKDSGVRYLDEAERETRPTGEFKAALEKICRVNMKKTDPSPGLFRHVFDFIKYDPDGSNRIFGNCMLGFTFDITDFGIEYWLKKLGVQAYLMGYNISHVKLYRPMGQANGRKYQKAVVQFEASYFNDNLKLGDFVYHVTTKNAAKKIVDGKRGLLPANGNLKGFRYPPRVYCFRDDTELLRKYAKLSLKTNAAFVRPGKADMEDFMDLAKASNGGRVVDTREFTCLKVDLSKAGDIRFYRDNLMNVGGEFPAVYTDSPIPARAISRYFEFTV